MWNVAVTYDDPSSFLVDKALFTSSLQSVITYLNKFINGSTTLNVLVKVSETSTGRFAGGATAVQDHVENGLVWVTTAAAKELAAGANLNGDAADLTIWVDPTTTYFKSLFFDTGAYDAPRTVPQTQTDGMTVLLHELMHGLGISSYRESSGDYGYGGTFRSTWDVYTSESSGKLLLDMPGFAAHGIDPVQVTSTSATQNNSHLGDATNLQNGYLDDLMNGLYFIPGHRYAISELDVLILQGLGYSVNFPDSLKLSDGSMTGKGLVAPSAAAGATLAATNSNLVHLTGTALPGSTTSILEHGIVVAQTRAGASGHWTLDAVIDPALAASKLTVRDGTHLLDSAPVAVSIDASAGLHLYGSAQYKTLTGGAHDDVFSAGPRGAAIDGGAGFDRVEYAEALAAAGIAKQADGSFKVSDAAGTDTLNGIERIRFSDDAIGLDVGVDGVAGQAYRLYQAAFNRTPDADGLGFWIDGMDHGLSLLEVARSFVGADEFRQLYGPNPTSADIVGRYYENVLHRAPDAGGFEFWVDAMDHKGVTAAEVLANFSQSQENVAALVGVMQNGVAYTPVA
jgi:hypothetical protein